MNENQLTKESVAKVLNTFKIRLASDMNALVKTSLEWIEDDDFIVIHSIEENIAHKIRHSMEKEFKEKNRI